MAIFKSQGIVFKTTKYGESSLILDVLTREKGLKSFITSGIRSTKSSNKASLFHHLNILEIIAYDKDEKLSRIKEAKMDYYYSHLTYDVVKSSIALFLLEVCRNAINQVEANEVVYDFILERLMQLDSSDSKKLSLFPIRFLLDFSQYLGFAPLDNYSEDLPYFDLLNGLYTSDTSSKYLSSKESSLALYHISSADNDIITSMSYPKSLRNQLIDDLITYYRLHIDHFKELKTIDVLRAIF